MSPSLPWFTIERYDRAGLGKDKVKRIHQEDFCQALGVGPDEKYESEGGPSLSKCAGCIERYSTLPAKDKLRLIQWVVYNYLIGNADAHAKNVSFLYKRSGIQLAPFYDLLSTVVYPALSKKMAMKIGNENRFPYIRKRHWKRFATEVGVKPDLVLNIVKLFAARILPVAQKLRVPDAPQVVHRILDVIKTQVSRTESL
jgi:serine/threonine-protein kinase HipA